MERISSPIYEQIGRAVVKYGLLYARRRYSRQIRMGAGAVAIAIGVVIAYLAKKEVPEG
ncbi:MAG TPA: hypothetical protein VHQ97_07700 [Solirubrobacterales bacterium]|jgi:hypothetical protein|nr:hypothetical protein [Solirubrobacterales bacterium]